MSAKRTVTLSRLPNEKYNYQGTCSTGLRFYITHGNFMWGKCTSEIVGTGKENT
jgi:hypothetical protein